MSTNTSENVAFGIETLGRLKPPLCFGREIHTVALVASAYRQRRVFLTCARLLPEQIRFVNLPPDTTLEDERRLFSAKGQDLIELLSGELRRIIEYPVKGYIEKTEIPAGVLDAFTVLQEYFLKK